ncbi:MAG: GspMb/PilO family protein [Pseudomonadota bacterium]
MDSFTFHNPTLVRRVGTTLVVGTSILLVIFAVILANIARSNYADISAQQETILRAERLVSDDNQPSTAKTFYIADTPQLAQSQMQTDMQALAQQNQVDLEVIRAEQIEQINGALRLSLTFNGVVFESQLGAFLASIAAHEPMIVVENISIRRARSGQRGVDSRPLAIRMTLNGFAAQ